MHINSLMSLTRLDNASNEGTHVQPSLWDLDMEEDDEPGGEDSLRYIALCNIHIFPWD